MVCEKIDLHVHTNASYDGQFSPKEVVDSACEKNMKVIAITDHNSIKGIVEALEYSKDKNVKIIPGVEISCNDKELGIYEIHVIGLFIDYNSAKLKNSLGQKTIDIKKAIEIIKESSGIPILAHPGVYLNKSLEIVNKFIRFGGKGIEVYYPYDGSYGLSKESSIRTINRFKEIAKKENLLISGGSDFHGSSRNVEIGYQGINEEELEEIQKLKLMQIS